MLIAHSPRMSSITLEKPFPFPGRTAGLRLALFERGVLEREVDIRFIWSAVYPPATWPVRRRYRLLFSFRT